jgi:DNA-binding response OmpR family regulator
MNWTLRIAESEPDLRDMYRMFFLTRGYKVEIASNGLDCQEKLRRATPAAIVAVPQLNGRNNSCWC